MPTQESSKDPPLGHYKCLEHGEFVVEFVSTEAATWEQPCPVCGVVSGWSSQAPAAKFNYTWNEQANEARRTPYTQAKAQSWNNYNEQRDVGVRLEKPTEAGIQVAAKALDHSERHPKPPAHIQQRDFARKQRKKKTNS